MAGRFARADEGSGGAVITATAQSLAPYQTLTMAVGFAPGTFAAFDGSYFASPFGWLQVLAGLGVAARQSWMQWYPPAVSECGPGLEYMLESFPLSSALPMIFRGAGDCSAIDWTLFGLTIANWSFLIFATILDRKSVV